MKKLDRYSFIWKAIQKHGYKYNYLKVDYKGSNIKVCIICPIHGEFYQTPNHHLKGQGCSKCYGLYKTTDKFIEEAKEIHGYKYDYSKVDYKGNKTKVCIICSIHGEFLQTPHEHLNGKGCSKCGGTKKLTKGDFIKQSIQIHKNKYDYSKVEYINNKTKVCIICHEHGEFYQTPNNHINQKAGCPKCNTSKLELEVMNLLDKNNIKYLYQLKLSFLKQQSLDFYLPYYNIAIECQGIQHFKPVDFFNGDKGFFETLERDRIKHEKCEVNNIKLLYFTHYDGNINNSIYNESNLFFNINNLIKMIKNKA